MGTLGSPSPARLEHNLRLCVYEKTVQSSLDAAIPASTRDFVDALVWIPVLLWVLVSRAVVMWFVLSAMLHSCSPRLWAGAFDCF